MTTRAECLVQHDVGVYGYISFQNKTSYRDRLGNERYKQSTYHGRKVMNGSTETFFAPQLFIPSGVKDIGFYSRAFGAVELRRWMNDDGSIHVAELKIDRALFHLHEESPAKGLLAPGRCNGTTVLVGLFTTEVDALMDRAVAAGGKVVSPARDYEYDYRQGEIEDPFGHRWLIQKKIA